MFRALSTLLVLLAAALIPGPTARAQGERGPYRLWIQEAVLDGRALIVVGRIETSRRLPSGETVDRISVARTLRGSARENVSVIGGSDAFRDRGRADQILFLDASAGGTIFRFVDAVTAEDDEGRQRVEALGRLLAAAAEPLERDRMRATLSFVRAEGGSTSAWVRRIVVRELERLSRRAPDLFDLAAIEAARSIPAGDLPLEERALLRRAWQRLEREAAVDWTRSPRAFRDPERRASFLRDLAAFEKGGRSEDRIAFLDLAARRFGAVMAPLLVKGLKDAQPEVREHCLHLLGELEAAAGAPALLAIARNDESPARRTAALEALEKIAPLDAVPELLRLAAQPRTRDGAWRVLAAVNSGEARLFLTDTVRALERDAQTDPEVLARAKHLLTPAFQREVALAREARRKRWRGDGRD